MSTETNDLSFDFSSNGNGQVTTLESFLGGEDTVEETPETNTPSDLDVTIKSEIEEISEEEGENIEEESNDEDKGKELKTDFNFDDLGEENEEEGSDITSNETDGLNYKNVIRKLVDEKIWDNIAFEVDGEEVSFEDVDIDEETFVEVFKQKLEDQKESLLQDRVSTEGISEFTTQLIEIEKNGGNVQQALESYQQYKNPLEGLDLNNESDQQAAIYLKYQAKGLKDKEILGLISTFKNNGELEDQANQAKTDIETAFNQQMEAINEQAIQKKADQAEALKTYRTGLSESLKSFELKESYRKKLLDVASKSDKQGNFELDSIYYQMRQDPEKAAELVLFLTDKKEYIKQITEEDRRDHTLNTMKRIKLISKGKSSNISIKKNPKSNNKNLLDLSALE